MDIIGMSCPGYGKLNIMARSWLDLEYCRNLGNGSSFYSGATGSFLGNGLLTITQKQTT